MIKKKGPMPEYRKQHLREVQQAKKEGKPKPVPAWKSYIQQDTIFMPFDPDFLIALTIGDTTNGK